jgi:hypothetical protein
VSRSWTERLKPRPRVAAGLALGRDYVAFAELALGADAGPRVSALDEIALETPLFCGAPGPAAAAALERALRPVAAALGRRYVPVHVSLPDPLVHWALLELDRLPAERAAREQLVALRFSRQGLNGSHCYACQPLGAADGKQLLLGMATDGRWLELVGSALATAGIVAWTVQANACRQFNAFHERLTRESGALVSAAPDAWSLILWDGAGRPRYARGRWRDGREDEAEIALEAERAVLAYVQGHPGRGVARVYLVGDDPAGRLAEALDTRLREPCTRLSLHEAPAGRKALARSAPLPFAAALEL